MPLSEDDIKRISKEVVKQLLSQFYQEAGKGIVHAILWAVLLGGLALVAWHQGAFGK